MWQIKDILSKDKMLLIISLISLVIFILIAYGICNNSEIFYGIDKPIGVYFQSVMKMHSTKFPIFITNFGDKIIILFFLFISLIFLIIIRFYKEALLIFSLMSGDFFLTGLLKFVFHRARPHYENYIIKYVDGYGFPSGHTTLAVCFYGIIIYLIARHTHNHWFKMVSITFLSLLILAVSFTRVYLCAHYLSDVIAGYCLAFFWLLISIWAYKNYKRDYSNNKNDLPIKNAVLGHYD